MTITVSTTDCRTVKALAILAAADHWQKGHAKDGRSFYAIPSETQPGLYHMTDCRECSCLDYQRHLARCKHIIAVRLRVTQLKALEPRTRTRKPEPKSDAAAIGSTRDLALGVKGGATYDDIWGHDGE